MMKRWGAILLVAAAAACSSNGSDIAATSTSNASTTTRPAATTTTTIPAGASVQQFASVIAENRAKLEEMVQRVEDQCLGQCSLAGSLNAQTLSLTAYTIRTQLNTLLIKGPAPAEIKTLVSLTLDQMMQTYQAGDKIRECGTTCSDEVVADLYRSAGRAKAQLAAWMPYGA